MGGMAGEGDARKHCRGGPVDGEGNASAACQAEAPPCRPAPSIAQGGVNIYRRMGRRSFGRALLSLSKGLGQAFGLPADYAGLRVGRR